MMPTTSEILLLDTHVWIWLLNDDPKARSARAAVERIEAAGRRRELKVSWVSVWEVSMLEAHGKLVLPVPLKEWIARGLSAPGISLCEADSDILIESARLPGGFQSDPMDCILVATARQLNIRLVTADRKILQYSEQNFVKTLPFGR